MPVRTSRFGFGFDPDTFSDEQAAPRQVSIKPDRGVHHGARHTELPAGFTPESKNFAIDKGALAPRSGLSRFAGTDAPSNAGGDTGLGEEILGGQEAFDESGNFYAIAASRRTFALLESQGISWRTLSDNGFTPSNRSTDFWQSATIYDDDNSSNIVAFTNNLNLPKFVNLSPGVGSVSSFTNVASFISKAKDVEAFDNRLVWLNIEESDTRRVGRVAWSQRGKPQSYDNVGTEAGFEDLVDMQGEAVGMVRHRGQLVILGRQELWRATPRRDTFAFDFVANIRNIGAPFPRTAVSTPIGVVFLAQDLELYVLRGSDVQPLGPAEEGGESRIQPKLQEEFEEGERAFAFYDHTKRTYNLYYSNVEGQRPTQAITYDLATNSFMFQEFPEELTFGYDITDPGQVQGGSTWDQQGTLTWDDASEFWDDFGITPAPIERRNALLFSSKGTAYRLRSDQTTDDGAEIDARWRSHGLRAAGDARFNWLSEVEFEYENDNSSSVSVAVSDDGFASTLDQINVSTVSSDQSSAFAPVRAEGRAPQFEIRTDGGGPTISRFWAEVSSKGRF